MVLVRFVSLILLSALIMITNPAWCADSSASPVIEVSERSGTVSSSWNEQSITSSNTAQEVRLEGISYPLWDGLIFKQNIKLLASVFFTPAVQNIFIAVVETAPETHDGLVWVTDGYRDEEGSLHQTGNAYDFRIKNVKGFDTQTFARSEIIENWTQKIKARLGDDYDVLYEANHLHIEYQPK